MDEDDGGLGAIEFSDSEIEADPVKKKNARTDQTEQDFQLVKDTYSAKIENGEVRIIVSHSVKNTWDIEDISKMQEVS